MKAIFMFVAVLLFVSLIHAAPKPAPAKRAPKTPAHKDAVSIPKPAVKRNIRPNIKAHAVSPNLKAVAGGKQKPSAKVKRQFFELFQGNSVYPGIYVQNPLSLLELQNAFSQAALLSGSYYSNLTALQKKQNATDSNGKPLPLDAKTLAYLEAAIGDKNVDAKGAAELRERIFALDGLSNINVINPFLLGKDVDGKPLKGDAGLPSSKAGKLGEANATLVALINPFRGSQLDAVFGPEIAPLYEIHYTPQGFSLDPLIQFGHSGISPIFISPATFNSAIGAFPGFGIVPNFNAAYNPYPYPYPYPIFPGYYPKNLKPNGKDSGPMKPDSSNKQPHESNGENDHPMTPETSSEYPNPEPSSESTSEVPATEASPRK